VTTRLVQVSVVAHDKKGNPVADLKREDFTLRDEGQPQPIQLFSVESNDPPSTPPPALPPDTFTNRFGQQPGVPASITVVLLDGLNTLLEDQAYARDQVIKFLQQLQPQDRVALYTLGQDLRLLHDFTNDASLLVRALARYRGENTPLLPASQPDEQMATLVQLNNFLAGSDERRRVFALDQRVDMTVTALDVIARHLSGLPGRKNLVWVSSSFPISFGYDTLDALTPPQLSMDQRFYIREAERAARSLSDANVALYPVDAQGLVGPNLGTSRPQPLIVPPSLNPRGLRYPNNSRITMPSHASIDTMNFLADRTGGRAFYNTNDIKGSIRRAIEDSRVTYVVGYYPDHGKWDGRFRSIKVEVKRAGIQVRARRGYFALPDEQLDPKQRIQVMREAALSPLDATTMALTVHVNRPTVPGSRLIRAQLQLDPHDVRLDHDNTRWKGVLDFDFIQRDPHGKILNATDQVLTLELLENTYTKAMREGFQFSKELEVVNDAAELRVITRDEATGAIGSVSIPVGKLFSAADP
jgi:VWFA-related protein